MKAKGRAGVVVLVVLLAGVAGVVILWRRSENPAVAEIERMMTALPDPMSPPAEGKAPEAAWRERREAMEAVEAKIQSLPEDQREQVRDTLRQQFFANMQEQNRRFLTEFFALPQGPERTKVLDEEIERQEERRQWAEARRTAEASSRPPGAGNAGNSSPSAAQRPRFGQMSPEERQKFRRRFLDNSTPQDRAQWAEYTRLVQTRRKERGLEPATGSMLFGPRRPSTNTASKR